MTPNQIYYVKHRERLLSRANAYYKANRTYRLVYQREWRKRNKHAAKVTRHLGVSIGAARQMLGVNA